MGLWLHDVGHMSHTEVANTLLAGTVAMMIGPLCFGWITDRLDQRGIKPIFVCGLGLSLFLLCQILMASTAEANPWLMAISFSFFGSVTTMNYAILAQSVPTHLTGRVSTSFNFLIFLLAFVVQWGLGLIINIWPTHEGTYPAIAYQIALGINLALQIPGMLLWLTFKPWKRELAHKPQT